MKSTIVATLVLAIAFILVSATGEKEQPKDLIRYIDVVGTAQTYIEPDEVYFVVELREFLKGKEKVTLDALEQQLQTAINAGGIPSSNLTVHQFDAAYYYKNKKNNEFLGSKQLQLKLTDAGQLEKFFSALADSDLKHIYYIGSTHSEMIAKTDANKVNATKAAQTKARSMVEAIGGKLGVPIYILENPIKTPQHDNHYFDGVMEDEEIRSIQAGNAAYQLKYNEGKSAFSPIKLVNEVIVRFEIQPAS